ncbi:MAG: RNA polymerase sigma factor [Geminicoccaceae bacterium]|nr:RNA polymerase sigma factor [Geminicoccaceae bacterium]MCX8100953.1 RNA polymerase sigma factor [Geminicoccaceae bacterium]MDW8370584.1 RNA polymerase sigma factor [Geminicoccaceae bacterium]
MGPTFTDELVAMLPRLRRFARALTRSVEEADDLVQDACERALANASSFTPGTRLDSWLYRILQNRWLDRCRAAQGRREGVPVEEAFELAGSDGRAENEARILLQRVGAALDTLPPDQRLVLVAVCVEGMA